MNEHYKLLAGQATDWCLAHCAEFDTNAWQWERKFAELIVEDCAKIANQNRTAMEMDRNTTLTSDAIKQHFGIKE